MKKCSVCKELHELGCFYNSKSSNDGKGYRCKPCDAVARAKWSTDNPERSRASNRRRTLKSKYGLTPEDYDRMYEEQGGVCAICSVEETITGHGLVGNFAIDHCHVTGKNRGLLCNRCNRAIGMFREDATILQSAIKYLEYYDTH